MNWKEPTGLIPWILGAYFVAMVICFGPATVESQKAFEKEKAECVPTGQFICSTTSWAGVEGLIKAMFWPFWISYKIAKGV